MTRDATELDRNCHSSERYNFRLRAIFSRITVALNAASLRCGNRRVLLLRKKATFWTAEAHIMSHIKTLLGRSVLATVLIASSAAVAQAEMIYHRGNGSEPETLDPAISTGVPESFIQMDVFEGLVTPAADAEPMPGVAESWDVSDDGLKIGRAHV